MEVGRGLIGELELDVIPIAVEIDAIFGKKVARWKEVNDEEKGHWDKALGHT